MSNKLAIVGASGKLGFATLNALLNHDLIPAAQIICTTSSTTGSEKLEFARQQGVEVRSANWDDDQEIWKQAFHSCSKVFLISSARIEKDFHDAPPGQGRESDHFPVIEAARLAGVQHIYYTSLAFAKPSASRVMIAHERTEDFLLQHCSGSNGILHTIIRQGLYNESWPLYLGHFDITNSSPPPTEIIVAGDGRISWTSIADLGLANALILSSTGTQKYTNKTFYLTQRATHTLADVAAMVSKATGSGTEIPLRVLSREEHEVYHIEERGLPEPFIKWWSKTYDALRGNECDIEDVTLERLLEEAGFARPKGMEESVLEMLRG